MTAPSAAAQNGSAHDVSGFALLSCPACAYDLRGLPEGAACPECGVEPGSEADESLILRSTPEHVRSMRRGTVLIRASLALWAAASAITVLASVRWPLKPLLLPPARAGVLWLCTIIAAYCLSLMGWWRLSAPGPRYTQAALRNEDRSILRSCLCMVLSIWVAIIASGTGTLTFNDALAGALGALFLGAVVLGCVTAAFRFIAAMLYLCWLGRAMGDTRLPEQAAVAGWFVPVLLVLGLFGAAVAREVPQGHAVFLIAFGLAIGLQWRVMGRIGAGLSDVLRRQTTGAQVTPAH